MRTKAVQMQQHPGCPRYLSKDLDRVAYNLDTAQSKVINCNIKR